MTPASTNTKTPSPNTNAQLAEGSATFFHALIDHDPDLVFVVDSLGTLQFANPACADLVRRPVSELVGMNVLDLVHPDDHGRAVESLGETNAKGPGRREPIVSPVSRP